MMVTRFNAHIGKNPVASETFFYIKKRDTFFIGLNREIKFINTFQKNVNFFLIMLTYKENIIYVYEIY